MKAAPSLCLIGCGNMGGAMLRGWLKNGYDKNKIILIDPKLPSEFKKLKIRHYKCASEYKGVPPQFIILAVKPQLVDEVAKQFHFLLTEKNILLSVVAGKRIATLAKLASDKTKITKIKITKAKITKAKIIRAMPNTPAQVGKAISICVDNGKINSSEKAKAKKLLASIGEVEWIKNEKLMDSITGLSGSGPAYIFYMAEVLARAGEKLGLPKKLATKLANQTIRGAGELLVQSKLSSEVLRKNVTSPNGTTEKGLAVLMHKNTGLGRLMEKTVKAAAKRAEQLS